MEMKPFRLWFGFYVLSEFLGLVLGNGRMLVPPQRSSLWRDPSFYRFRYVYRNYNDHTLNCGGFWRMHQNNGKCGVCGDPWDADKPRPNEAGGIYARGIIGRTYSTDKRFIDTVIQVTSSISGYFEFNICPNDDVTKRVSRDCLDNFPMRILNKDRSTSYGRRYIPDISAGQPGVVELSLEIPEGLECTQCVLQWRWHGANNYGLCRNGRWGKGCGDQPEMYNCADIAILPDDKIDTEDRQASRPIIRRPTPIIPSPSMRNTTTSRPTTTTTSRPTTTYQLTTTNRPTTTSRLTTTPTTSTNRPTTTSRPITTSSPTTATTTTTTTSTVAPITSTTRRPTTTSSTTAATTTTEATTTFRPTIGTTTEKETTTTAIAATTQLPSTTPKQTTTTITIPSLSSQTTTAFQPTTKLVEELETTHSSDATTPKASTSLPSTSIQTTTTTATFEPTTGESETLPSTRQPSTTQSITSVNTTVQETTTTQSTTMETTLVPTRLPISVVTEFTESKDDISSANPTSTVSVVIEASTTSIAPSTTLTTSLLDNETSSTISVSETTPEQSTLTESTTPRLTTERASITNVTIATSSIIGNTNISVTNSTPEQPITSSDFSTTQQNEVQTTTEEVQSTTPGVISTENSTDFSSTGTPTSTMTTEPLINRTTIAAATTTFTNETTSFSNVTSNTSLAGSNPTTSLPRSTLSTTDEVTKPSTILTSNTSDIATTGSEAVKSTSSPQETTMTIKDETVAWPTSGELTTMATHNKSNNVSETTTVGVNANDDASVLDNVTSIPVSNSNTEVTNVLRPGTTVPNNSNPKPSVSDGELIGLLNAILELQNRSTTADGPLTSPPTITKWPEGVWRNETNTFMTSGNGKMVTMPTIELPTELHNQLTTRNINSTNTDASNADKDTVDTLAKELSPRENNSNIVDTFMSTADNEPIATLPAIEVPEEHQHIHSDTVATTPSTTSAPFSSTSSVFESPGTVVTSRSTTFMGSAGGRLGGSRRVDSLFPISKLVDINFNIPKGEAHRERERQG